MRPVVKGIAPKTYTSYSQAKDDLRNAIGSYCSYCEMNISNQPDIEHVVPKSKAPVLENDWNNFLLACKTCNTIKSIDNDTRSGYVFPDTHNTAYAYRYTQTTVIVNTALNDEEQKLAQATLDLVKINREKDTSGRTDDRRVARVNEWNKALESLEDFVVCSTDEMARQIGRSPSGFHSSWLEIFREHPKVKAEILKQVVGTDMSCYCVDFNPCQMIFK